MCGYQIGKYSTINLEKFGKLESILAGEGQIRGIFK